jgi:AcrR family transcriptional regulator
MRALPGSKARVPSGQKPPAREEVAAEQRRHIMRVATELIAKRGYQGTTTELVVRRAKVGYATFYRYFPDKEACFMAVFDETFARSTEALAAVFHSGEPELPWAERVAATITALYRGIAADPILARACIVESLTAGPKIRAGYERALVQLGAIFEPGRMERPGGEALPPTLESTLAGGVLWIAYQLLIVNQAAKLPERIPEAIQLALAPYLGEQAALAIASPASLESA